MSGSTGKGFVFRGVPLAGTTACHFVIERVVPRRARGVGNIACSRSVFHIAIIIASSNGNGLRCLAPAVAEIIISGRVSTSTVIFCGECITSSMVLAVNNRGRLANEALIRNRFAFGLCRTSRGFMVSRNISIGGTGGGTSEAFAFRSLAFDRVKACCCIMRRSDDSGLRHIGCSSAGCCVAIAIASSARGNGLMTRDIVGASPGTARGTSDVMFAGGCAPGPASVSISVGVSGGIRGGNDRGVATRNFRFTLRGRKSTAPAAIGASGSNGTGFRLNFARSSVNGACGCALARISNNGTGIACDAMGCSVTVAMSLSRGGGLMTDVARGAMTIRDIITRFMGRCSCAPSAPPAPPRRIPGDPRANSASGLAL